MKMNKKTSLPHACVIQKQLKKDYSNAHSALHFKNPLELLVATILSAQCTDARVNMVTPALFKRFKKAKDYASADPKELQTLIRSTGFYVNKTKSIIGACREISEKYSGQVPNRMEDLVKLPGVGRKTANVVLGNAYGIPSIMVDTHVLRLSCRLGLTKEKDPVKVEFNLMKQIAKKDWTLFSHMLIDHGRKVCQARRPFCSQCHIEKYCPKIGVIVKG